MPSSIASSATLSIHSGCDGEFSWDETDTVSEVGTSTDDSPEEQLQMEWESYLSKERIKNSSDDATDLSEVSHGSDFVLSAEYLEEGDDFPLPAVLKAASNPDPRVLKAVIAHSTDRCTARENAFSEWMSKIRGTIPAVWMPCPRFTLSFQGFVNLLYICDRDVGIRTPLLEAIRARSADNIKTLLDAKACPNGILADITTKYSALFLRFRPLLPSLEYPIKDMAPRDSLMLCMGTSQLAPLTTDELEDRSVEGIAPFWCEEGFTRWEFLPNGDALSSLIVAAKVGSIEIFDQLMTAGADASFWMRQFPTPPILSSHSSFCISTPLHAAIEARNHGMVRHLLDLGFDPNVMPLANPTRCVTPLMATITACDPFNQEAFDILMSCPRINPYILTPVYRVHILHFAVARLDIGMLKHVISKIPQVWTTALGHRLLHIACMPANSLHIQRHSIDISSSIHDTRDLSHENDPDVDLSSDCIPPSQPREFYTEHFEAQTAVVKLLWDKGLQGIDEQDIYGNTPLHYLAGHHYMNNQLLNWWLLILKNKNVKNTWKHCENAVAATPEDLCRAAENVIRSDQTGHKPWFGRQQRKERIARKEYIWQDLLTERWELEDEWIDRTLSPLSTRGYGGIERGRTLRRGSARGRGRGRGWVFGCSF